MDFPAVFLLHYATRERLLLLELFLVEPVKSWDWDEAGKRIMNVQIKKRPNPRRNVLDSTIDSSKGQLWHRKWPCYDKPRGREGRRDEYLISVP